MKVDVTKIEGYNEMSPEEKLKAIENFEFDDPDMSEFVSKKTFDKTASELAKKKKELAEKMTEDEARALADKESLENMQKELAELRKEREIANNRARFLALGYSEELAVDTAQALAEGDMEKVFKNQKLHQEAYEKAIKDGLLGETARQKGGGEGHNVMTKEKLKKMSFEDRALWAKANPEEYSKIYGGN